MGLLLALIALAAFPVDARAQEACGDSYIVAPGDTLAEIASRCGTTIGFILLVNPQIENPNLIYPGQEFKLPDADEVAALNGPADAPYETIPSAVAEKVALNAGEHWVDVDISQQKVFAYAGEELVRTFTVSTGTWRHPTVTGQFAVYLKLRQDDMDGPGYDLEDVPNTMYFHKGYALHGTYWHDNFGVPMSHGCVNMTIEDSAWMFDFASEGTLVNVHP